jgi:hypothetical protein
LRTQLEHVSRAVIFLVAAGEFVPLDDAAIVLIN